MDPRSGSGGRAIYDWTSGGTAFAQKTGPLGRQLILGSTQPVRLYGAHVHTEGTTAGLENCKERAKDAAARQKWLGNLQKPGRFGVSDAC